MFLLQTIYLIQQDSIHLVKKVEMRSNVVSFSTSTLEKEEVVDNHFKTNEEN